MDLTQVTDENVQDIVDTAAYGGITYWATQPTADEFEKRPEDKMWTIVEYDGHDLDGRVAHYLSHQDIREAYSKVLDLDQRYVNHEIHGYVIDSWRDRDEHGIDCGHIDAGAADVIVQIACFGEVIYG